MDAGLHWLALQVEVELASLGPQGIKLVFHRGAPRPLAHRQRRQAMVGQHDQLPSLVAPDVLGDDLALVQHANLVPVGADRDWRTNSGGAE